MKNPRKSVQLSKKSVDKEFMNIRLIKSWQFWSALYKGNAGPNIRLERLGVGDYSTEDVERHAVRDEVDREIVQRIREAGVPGVLPKVAAADLNQRGKFWVESIMMSPGELCE